MGKANTAKRKAAITRKATEAPTEATDTPIYAGLVIELGNPVQVGREVLRLINEIGG